MTILGGSKTNEHQIIKLDQNGVQKSSPRTLVLFLTTILQLVELQNFHLTVRNGFIIVPLDGLWFLDFDREKGEFSNYKFHNIRHKLHLATGLEWSPNSRFLYISSSDSLFQYDTWVEDLVASENW